MEKVSVVVITYNSELTVLESLDSIKNQTYPFLDLIIADDCSNDSTVDIVEKWILENRERFISVKLLRNKKNYGITRNCNRGIKYVSTEYFQLLAGDDILIEDAIEKKYGYAKKNKVDIVLCKVEPFGSSAKKVYEMKKFCEKNYKVIEKGWQAQYKKIVKENIVVGPSGGFYRTSFFRDMGGYDERFLGFEDYPFLFKYIVKGNSLSIMDEILVRYRIHEKSVSQLKNKNFLKSELKFLLLERLPHLIKEKEYEKIYQQLTYYLKNLMKK